MKQRDEKTGDLSEISVICKAAMVEKNPKFLRYLSDEHLIIEKMKGVPGVV